MVSARETVVWNNDEYHRYPNAQGVSDRIYFRGKTGSLHRNIWEHHQGPVPTGMHVVYVNGDATDNRIENLKIVSPGDRLKSYYANKPKKESDVQEWLGIRYRRYPDSKRSVDRLYFKATRANGSYLHRDVWEWYHGKIPHGHEIHHSDGNTLNNRIENLECLSTREHRGKHSEYSEERKAVHREHLDRVRPMSTRALKEKAINKKRGS